MNQCKLKEVPQRRHFFLYTVINAPYYLTYIAYPSISELAESVKLSEI